MQGIKDKLIVALDVDTLEKAGHFVDILYPTVKIFKVGSQLFTAAGPEAVRMINQKGAKVFLDLKFCDIPHTVAKAVESAQGLGVYMLSVHTFGASREMLSQAVKATQGEGSPLIIGVTLLTSLDKKMLKEFGVMRRSLANEVMALAKLAKEEGLNGVVCAPKEIACIRRNLGEKFIIVTPGVRPKGASLDGHKRAMTPAQAISQGADYIVVGRPILEAKDPLKAVKEILRDRS